MKKILIVCITGFIFLVISDLFSRDSGWVSATYSGCTCHGNRRTEVTLTSSSPSEFTTYPGYEIEITIRLACTFYSWAGINISVCSDWYAENNIGTLTPVSSYLKLWYDELTHNEPVAMQNGYVDFVFKWMPPDELGDYYFRAVGTANANDGESNNGDRWNFMTYKYIRVVEPPRKVTLTSPVGGEHWCTGDHHNITWTSQYIDNVKIEISTDGGNTFNVIKESTPASSGSYSWTVPSNKTGLNNRIRISDPDHPTVEDISPSDFRITTKTGISSQLSNFELCEGDTVNLGISAVGVDLVYQWRKDGQNIPDANSSQYNIYGLKQVNTGFYDVVVSGLCGDDVTSNKSRVSIYEIPEIKTQLKGDSVCVGDSYILSMVLQNLYNNIEWFKDNQLIQSDKLSVYRIDTIKTSDEGNYHAIVSGVCGEQIYSDTVFFKVNSKPSFSKHPDNLDLYVGDSARFVVSSDVIAAQYKWRKNEISIKKATDSILTISSVQFSDSGLYDCIVYNYCGADTSQKAKLNVYEPLPGAVLSFLKDTVSLGYVLADMDTSIVFENFIINSGTDTLNIESIEVKGQDSSSFRLIGETTDITIIPDSNIDLFISYYSQSPGPKEAFIEFKSNSKENPDLYLSAFGTVIDLDIPKEFDFGVILWDYPLPVDSMLTIRNNSNIPIEVDTFLITGENPENFSYQTVQFPLKLDIGDSCNVQVEFNPPNFLVENNNAEFIVGFKFNEIKYEVTSLLKCYLYEASVKESLSRSLNIYPNPAEDYLNIELDSHGYLGCNLSLYDQIGREVYHSGNLIPENQKINYTLNINEINYHFADNLYLLKLEINGIVIVKPVIILK